MIGLVGLGRLSLARRMSYRLTFRRIREIWECKFLEFVGAKGGVSLEGRRYNYTKPCWTGRGGVGGQTMQRKDSQE